MNDVLVSKPAPIMAMMTDQSADVFRFAIEAFANGSVALASLVEIRGGAARSLGSQMAVAADGRYCGYVSGGCVEAAVASEAHAAMEKGRDRMVKFGDGSPFFDIVLPCGGGITIAIHLLRDISALTRVLNRLNQRQLAGLEYAPHHQRLRSVTPPTGTGWVGDLFQTAYRPKTRVVVSGRTIEAETVVHLANASGYEVNRATVDVAIRDTAELIDAYTAVALLHHDLETEMPLLKVALATPAFYIGALGSTRTHRNRVEHLEGIGLNRRAIARIKAPIGMFGPTKDATSLALSVLADIAASRLAAQVQ
jgi:xanthine dehydrogenase accessory factor